ncbi:helix-turn-helix domain-containing protein [Nocardiopsis sediminis]|uniref:Helix-turn-helix domain-containing protein n=1 Tax=Nocardiopsis sediminis TaxID=1778267 RepID=A0ABV8FQB7_9ACTN
MAPPPPDTPAAPAAPFDGQEFGARIRALRMERGLSLRKVAGLLGISPSALSQIERGKMRPSVTRLYAIMSALDAPVTAAFSDDHPGSASAPAAAAPPGDDGVVVARSGEAATLTLGHGVRYRRLTPVATPGVNLFESTYPPGACSSQNAEFVAHNGREIGNVVSGALTVDVGFDSYELGPGDSIAFSSGTPHRITNNGTVPAVAIWMNLAG